jgi:hypothetical protein
VKHIHRAVLVFLVGLSTGVFVPGEAAAEAGVAPTQSVSSSRAIDPSVQPA